MARKVLVVCVVLLASAALASAAGYERLVPAAASNPGLHGSHWSTDLSIFNRSSEQASSVEIAFLADAEGVDDPTEVTVEVEPMGVLEIHDVVAALFGEHRPGALRLRSDKPFEASSRTFNDGGGEGRYGEGIPAIDPDDVPLSWVLMGAANTPGPDGVRSNLGLANCGAGDKEVMLALNIPETDEWFGPVTVELGPHGWLQQDAFAVFGLADRQVGSAVVHGLSSNVIGYLSLVENRTGDGSFILPVEGELIRTVPRQYEVTLTLTYTEGVEVYVIGHDGGVDLAHDPPTGKPYAVVPDPLSGYSVDLEFTSPASLCYTVLGMAGDQGGEVEVEILYTPRGESGGSRTCRPSRGDAGSVRCERCFDMD